MEERQEAAINGRRSQNSERVRAHLYERGFRQEPDGRVLVGEVDRGLTSRHRRRAPQGHGRSAVPPDDSDMHLGRERPPKTRLGTVIGGWQRGSPHAPLVNDSDVDTGTDEETGGTERRPVRSREVQQRRRVPDRATPSPQHASMRVAPCELHSNWGNGAPEFAFPPLSLRFPVSAS